MTRPDSTASSSVVVFAGSELFFFFIVEEASAFVIFSWTAINAQYTYQSLQYTQYNVQILSGPIDTYKPYVYNTLLSVYTELSSTYQKECILIMTKYIYYIPRVLEYHSVYPLVRIGTPHPLSRTQVCSPPYQRGGHTLLRVRRWGVPFQRTGEEAYHSVYSVLITNN